MRTLQQISDLLEDLRIEVATIVNDSTSKHEIEYLSEACFHIETAWDKIDDAMIGDK
jgi:hypothetical protein